MPLYAIIAKDRPNGLAQRLAVRPEHLKHLDSLGERLVLAGPFQDEEGKPTGSLVVIEAADLAAATADFEKDPFIREGLFGSYEITRWGFSINKAAGR